MDSGLNSCTNSEHKHARMVKKACDGDTCDGGPALPTSQGNHTCSRRSETSSGLREHIDTDIGARSSSPSIFLSYICFFSRSALLKKGFGLEKYFDMK